MLAPPSQSETQKRDGVPDPAAGEQPSITPHTISGGRAHLHVSVHANT